MLSRDVHVAIRSDALLGIDPAGGPPAQLVLRTAPSEADPTSNR